MNILYICQDYGIPVLGNKGAAVHVREMIAAMRRAGHRIALVAPAATKGAWDEPAQVDGQFLHLPASDEFLASVQAADDYCSELGVESDYARDIRRILYDRYLQGKLLRKFSRMPPDLIYVRASLHSIAPLALAREIDRPLVVELNAPLVAENMTYRQGGNEQLASHAEHKLLSAADAVLVVSEYLVDHAISCGAQPDRVHVIPNGVDPRLFHPAAPDTEIRQRLGIGDGPVLGFVGGLRQWHGVEILPELLQRLVGRFPQARLVIVGSGPLESTLSQRLEALGLSAHALFTGMIDHQQVAGVIRQFDIALAPYPQLDHNFYFSPLKLFEYMACGRAVVAADVGQIRTVVDHAKTGFLYPAGDLDQLADRCATLLSDPASREVVGDAAAQEILKKYTWDSNVSRVIQIAQSTRDGS
jgi:glycosyltransferase involved in cell wall biosynthesis